MIRMVSGSCVGTALRGAWGTARTLRPLPLAQGPKADPALPGSQLRTIAGGRGGAGLSGPHHPHASSHLEKLQKPHDGQHSLQKQHEQSQMHPRHSGGGNLLSLARPDSGVRNPLSQPRPDSGGGNPLPLWRPGHPGGSPLLAAAAQTASLSGTVAPPRHLAAAAALMAQPSVSFLHSVARICRGARFGGLEKHDLGAAAAMMPSVSGLQTEARVGRDTRFSSLEERDVEVFREVVGAAGVVEDPEALEPYNRCVWGRRRLLGVKGRCTPPHLLLWRLSGSQIYVIHTCAGTG